MGKTKRKVNAGKVFALFFCVLFITALGVFSFFVIDVLNEIKGKNKDNQALILNIESGDSTSKIADKLQNLGIIKYKSIFELIAKSEGLDRKMQIGSFEILKGESYSGIFYSLQQIKEHRASVRLTFPEGSEVNEIIAKLVESGVGDAMRYENAISYVDFGYDYIPSSQSENRLEGFLYPDTYDFYLDELEENVLKKFVDNFNAKITQENILPQVEESGMTLKEVLTLASIIQSEGQKIDEFPLISSVFHNRLAIKMKLQSCATVNYILPAAERKWILTYEDMAINDPYNTYVYSGLPPTPISNPGIEAIKAAISPVESEYIYFSAKGDGYHAFAITLEEHEANADKYLN